MSTLGDELPKEIARNKELLKIYRSIGPAGMFGFTMIKRDIEEAERATAEGDTVGMIRAYAALKDNE